LMIEKYKPKGKSIPILSGEWGYSTAGMSEDQQAKFLSRQWLFNMSQEIPLSIWYDWHDDGPDPKEGEHHFGTVRYEYRKDSKPVYEPKPSYQAAKTLMTQLNGYTFNKRLALEKPTDYCLLFTKENDMMIAAWTSSHGPREVIIPASPGVFHATNVTG